MHSPKSADHHNYCKDIAFRSHVLQVPCIHRLKSIPNTFCDVIFTTTLIFFSLLRLKARTTTEKATIFLARWTPKILVKEGTNEWTFGQLTFGAIFPGVQNVISWTLKCTFGVSGFRGSVGGPGDCNSRRSAFSQPSSRVSQEFHVRSWPKLDKALINHWATLCTPSCSA